MAAKRRKTGVGRGNGDDGRWLTGFLADENRFDRHAFWRLGGWGFAAVAAVALAVTANQFQPLQRRAQTVLGAGPAPRPVPQPDVHRRLGRRDAHLPLSIAAMHLQGDGLADAGLLQACPQLVGVGDLLAARAEDHVTMPEARPGRG